jgi:heme exporter protein C
VEVKKNRNRNFTMALGNITFIMMLFALYAIFFYAPLEKTMGIIQKIFYLHVSSAFFAFFAFLITFIASILFLSTKARKWDTIAVCSVEVGIIFCTIVLTTGPIWAKPIWNVWWTWDPRLVTTLILWFIYVAYLMLRRVLEGNQRLNISAVLGIIGFVNVPLTFFTIRLWRSIHPVLITSRGININTAMKYTLLITAVAFCCLFIFLLVSRIRIETLKIKLEEVGEILEEKVQLKWS